MNKPSPTALRALMLTGAIGRHAGGMYWSVRRLGQSLVESGTDVRVVSYDVPGAREVLDEWLPLKPVLVDKRFPGGFGYAPDMLDRVMELDADVVHTHGLWMYPSCVATRWSRQTGRPHIISPRGMLDDWALSHSPLKKRIAGWLYENRHLRSAACLHALAPGEVSAIRSYGLTNPICLIPNGVDLPVSPTTAPAPWEAMLGNSRRVLLFLGRIHPKKGIHELVEGWNRLLADKPSIRDDWALVIAGWDDQGSKRRLMDRLAQSGCRDSICLMDALYGESKQAALEKAEAFILPSHGEGLPVAVLESWAARRPVLMTPQCNLQVGFEQGAAIATQPDPIAISESIRQMIGMSPADRNAMGQRGHDLVCRQFTWKTIAEQMAAVYRWVAGNGPDPACVLKGAE